MINFRQIMDMYDNWNGITKVNDDELEVVVKGKTVDIMECLVPFSERTNVESYDELFEMEVVAFGFYDNEFCVRVRPTFAQAFKKLSKKISENSKKGIDK